MYEVEFTRADVPQLSTEGVRERNPVIHRLRPTAEVYGDSLTLDALRRRRRHMTETSTPREIKPSTKFVA